MIVALARPANFRFKRCLNHALLESPLIALSCDVVVWPTVVQGADDATAHSSARSANNNTAVDAFETGSCDVSKT
jgi:hypothetical protein